MESGCEGDKGTFGVNTSLIILLEVCTELVANKKTFLGQVVEETVLNVEIDLVLKKHQLQIFDLDWIQMMTRKIRLGWIQMITRKTKEVVCG
eukprot:7389569-Ditylum_brightwellii.AAC.1